MTIIKNPKIVVEAWCPCGTSCFAPVKSDVSINQLIIDNSLRSNGWTKLVSATGEDIWQCKKCSAKAAKDENVNDRKSRTA